MAVLNIKDSFSIDAAKILAKLHRGACETHKDMMFFNSGVVGDENIAPAACEKSKITFDTNAGQYELGVVIQKEIQCSLKHTADDILDKMTENKKEQDEKAKITDNPDQKSVNEFDMSFMRFLREEDDKSGEDVLIDPFSEPKDAPDEVKKMVKENQDELKKTLESFSGKAVAYLQDYMKVFAGEAESKKINDKAIAKVYLSDSDADPTKIKYNDGVITGIDDKERQEAWHEQLKKKSDTGVYVITNLCFKIAYALNMSA